LENAIRRLGTISPDGSISHITGGNFAKGAITINGWLRDFLWSQATSYSIIRIIVISIWFNFQELTSFGHLV
jgi:hypothetical protein